MKEYFEIIFETEEKDYICVWYSDINSGFVVENDRIPCFSTEDTFKAYCNAKGYVIKGSIVYNLTSLMSFAAGKTDDFDPSFLLDFWNICSDLSFSLDVHFLGDDDNEALSEIYDTLFFMSSSDSNETDTKSSLSLDDISDLRSVVTDGCRIVIENLVSI